MQYLATHGYYKELVETLHQTICTNDLNADNIDEHFNNIIAIFQDGIDLPETRKMFVTVIFADGVDVDLNIFDYVYNLMFWTLKVDVGEPIGSIHLFWYENLTKSNIKEYMDNVFVRPQRTKIPFIELNNIPDHAISKFRDLTQFQMWLNNTLCFEDLIDLAGENPEVNDTMHFDGSGYSIEDVKDEGMKATYKQVKYLKDSDNCLRDALRTGEAVSVKQYKEVAVNIGSKPDGRGGVFPTIINHSFINGGLSTPEEMCIESSIGRIAQILQKGNVGESGAFARRLGLNNQDTKIHYNPKYACATKNFQKVTIKNSIILDMYDMRYYRFKPNDVDHLLNASTDKFLIGQTLYFRSPMTCASAAAGHGICYKCYGDLAYVNGDINVGQIASELLSSIYTQILLSAKHLLESKVIKMNWSEGFSDIFEINFNTIQLYQDKEYRGIKIIIPPDIQNDDELDDVIYSDYITAFDVKLPDGTMFDIHTSDSDSIYIHPDLMEIIEATPGSDEGTVLDAAKLTDIPVLFMVNFKNSELSRTMEQIKKIIDNKTFIKNFDRNTILEEFIDTNIEGGIKLNAVHFEVLLMNQLRSADDMLLMPDWERENEPCQILTLGEALSNSLSISVRLQNNKIDKVLISPDTPKVTKPSNMDVYFMEKPQTYIENKDLISDDYKLKNDIEESTRSPIYFLDGDSEQRDDKKK